VRFEATPRLVRSRPARLVSETLMEGGLEGGLGGSASEKLRVRRRAIVSEEQFQSLRLTDIPVIGKNQSSDNQSWSIAR
jgi:hypothetical protein